MNRGREGGREEGRQGGTGKGREGWLQVECMQVGWRQVTGFTSFCSTLDSGFTRVN
jgi:hypothetical protein